MNDGACYDYVHAAGVIYPFYAIFDITSADKKPAQLQIILQQFFYLE